jgi:hypothetical protein
VPSTVAPTEGPSSSIRQGEEEGREEEDDEPSSPTLAAPPPSLSSLPSPEAGPSGSGTLPKLLSPCGNWVLRRFTRFTASSGKGRALGSWDSTTELSR